MATYRVISVCEGGNHFTLEKDDGREVTKIVLSREELFTAIEDSELVAIRRDVVGVKTHAELVTEARSVKADGAN